MSSATWPEFRRRRIQYEVIMNGIKCAIIGLYRIITLGAVAFTTWKIVEYWQKRAAEKADHAAGVPVGATAEKKQKKPIT
jgi:hypothetical protein